MQAEHKKRRNRRKLWIIPAALASALLLLTAGWSLHVLFAPPAPLPAAAQSTTITATTGKVERIISMPAEAKWQDGATLLAATAGTLTQLLAGQAAPVNEGSAVYSVDMRPAIIAQGDVPTYREMTPGISGTDVAQLQAFLARQGFNPGAANGNFNYQTESAVRGWQKQTGQEVTGSVALGSIIFTPQLPANLAWSEETRVGKSVLQGDELAQLSGKTINFTMRLSQNQARMLQEGMPVSISTGKNTWQAAVGPTLETTPDGERIIALAPAPDTDSICGTDCSTIPAAGTDNLIAEITVQAAVSGITVPNAALQVGKNGRVVVQDTRGKNHEVKVLASSGGRSVVKGIKNGMQLRVPLGQQPAGGITGGAEDAAGDASSTGQQPSTPDGGAGSTQPASE